MICHLIIVFLIMVRVLSLFHEWHWTYYGSVTRIFLSLSFIPIVDLTYWFVFRRYSVLKGIIAAFAAVVIWAIVVSFLDVLTQNSLESFFFIARINLGDAKIVPGLVGYIILYSLGRKYIDRIFRFKELQLQKTENTLHALKAQLNPHFFFNSLNHLYGTALSEKAVLTSKSIEILSDMMRYTLAEANENMVPLSDELNFVKNYIYLQNVRLPRKDTIQIETAIDDYKGDKKIAPMLLLPFIENAFKYGISIDHSCFVNMSIKISERELNMNITNSVKNDFQLEGNNTGIANTRKRLDLLYDKNYKLKCEKTDLTYQAVLSVKLVN